MIYTKIRTIWLNRTAKKLLTTKGQYNLFADATCPLILLIWWTAHIFLIAVSKYLFIWAIKTCNYQRKNKNGICLESSYNYDEQLSFRERVENQTMNMFPWEHSFNTPFTVSCRLFTTSPSGFHQTQRQRELLSSYKN